MTTMARDQNALTYRVRRLPPEIDKSGVVELLTQSLATEDCVPTIHVCSLCRSLDSPETTSAKEATVTFSVLPSQFQGKEEWSLTAVYHGLEHHIVIDKQFLDFTVLSEVSDDEHILDCVAISGLGSHPFGSWQQRGESDFMWLRDALPRDLNGIRTIIYGYDTHLTESKSFKSTYDIALALANRLVSVGFGWPSAKPVIFLCHSLGGIIFKETVVILASTSGQEPSFLGKLRATLFFGVPNVGMEITQLRTMVKGDPTEQLIEDLAPRSPRLSSLDSLFSGHQATRDFRVVSFYETETTKTVHFLGGRWVRDGPEVVMVEKESAIQKCSRHPDEVHFIDKDHSAMVKFSRGDVGYTRVVESLRKFLRQEDVSTLGLRRQTTDISFVSEESDGQNQDGEIHKPAIQQKVRATWFKRRSEEILESLRSELLNRRLDDIAAQYSSTFEWIFSEGSLQFVPWLLKGNGAYWFEGKPAAGKSTLMKYIYQNDRTEEMLQQWARSGQLIQASFFFYHRGTTAQKSFSGLLQSILYQILRRVPELCSRIPTSVLPKKNSSNRYTWDLASLRRTFSWILSQQKSKLFICLFIDALDEFDGHLELISEFMASFISTEQAVHCKICFSSRPREIIQNRFGQFPNFRIHDYTKTDIRMYTEGRLLESPGLEEALRVSREEREKVDRVADQIINQADGVFLWVRLALDDIIKALSQCQGVSAHDLEMLLQLLPPELEAFYTSITERIPQYFRWESYLALDVTLRTDELIGLRELFEIITCWPCKTLQECFEQRRLADSGSGPPINHKNLSSFLKKLKDSCGGLLEIDERQGRMRLMHETVRAFLIKPTFRQLVLGKIAIFRPQNGYTELAKYYLTEVQHFDRFYHPKPGLYQDFGEKAAKYCFLAESTTGACQFDLIESFNPRKPQEFIESSPPWFLPPGTSGIHFAVVSNLLLYMRRKFEATEGISRVDLNAEHPLFPHLCRAAMYFCKNATFRDSDKRFEYGPLAKLLIDKGVDTKTPFHGVTPFEWLLTRQTKFRNHPHIFRYYPRPGHPGEPALHVIKALIDAGEDPNVGLCETKIRKGEQSWKPLHFSSGSVAHLLLEKNADVNSKGPRGMTPLDVAIRTYGKHRYLHRFERPEATLDLLIRNEGLISSSGMKYLPACISRLKHYGHDVENMHTLPQRSEEMGYLSKKDVVLAPVQRIHPKVSRTCLTFCGCCCSADVDDGGCCTGCVELCALVLDCCCVSCCSYGFSTKVLACCVEDDVEDRDDGCYCCCVM